MSHPNYYLNPGAYNRVLLGGHLLLAVLVEVDGIKIEGDWQEQKPTDKSGASWNWKGLKPAGPHKLTFETGRAPWATSAEMEADMRLVYEMLQPSPRQAVAAAKVATPATTTTPAAPATAEGLLEQAKQALENLNNPAKAKDPTAGTTGFSLNNPTTPAANPGPRPPTLSIENALPNYVGTLAVAMKSYEIKPKRDVGGMQHILELNAMKPLVPAGTGLAPAPKSAVGTGGTANASGGGASGVTGAGT